jgi:ferritin-like metal-binding protein YciE
MASTVQEQLVVYLKDAHSIEEQALTQLRRAPDIAGTSGLERTFRQHLSETEEHERLVRKRLESYGAAPSAVKDTVMKAGGVGFLLFARVQPDTPGKLLAHAYSYEALEEAAYDLLLRVAVRAGDQESVATAERIRSEERSMMERLGGAFDEALEASLAVKASKDDPARELTTYLAEAHALEAQSVALLERGQKIAGGGRLATLYSEHLEEAVTTRSSSSPGCRPSAGADRSSRTPGCDSEPSTGACSSRPSRTPRASWRRSPTHSSIWRSPATSSCAASPNAAPMKRLFGSPARSLDRKEVPRRRSPEHLTPRRSLRSRPSASRAEAVEATRIADSCSRRLPSCRYPTDPSAAQGASYDDGLATMARFSLREKGTPRRVREKGVPRRGLCVWAPGGF